MLGNGRCFVRRPPRWVRMSMWGPGGRCVGAGSARGAPLQHLLPSEVVAVQCVPRGAEDSACRGDGDVLHERCPWCARHDAETHATFVSCLWSGALLFFPRASSSERAFRGERPLALPRDEVRRPERPHGVQVEGRAFQRACAICVPHFHLHARYAFRTQASWHAPAGSLRAHAERCRDRLAVGHRPQGHEFSVQEPRACPGTCSRRIRSAP